MSLVKSPTMTPAARAARRTNARKSAGPRTAEGKSRSRLNALKHGGYASHLAWSDDSLRALGEDPVEYRKLFGRLIFADGPYNDPLWNIQVEDLTRLYWRRRRLDRAWEVLMARRGRSNPDAAALTSLTPEGLLLFQQIESLDRAIDRKTRLLLRMREGGERHRRVLEREARQRIRKELAAADSDLDDPSEDDLVSAEAELALLREMSLRAGPDPEDPPEAPEKDSETPERTEETIENNSAARGMAEHMAAPCTSPAPAPAAPHARRKDGFGFTQDTGQPPSPQINPNIQG